MAFNYLLELIFVFLLLVIPFLLLFLLEGEKEFTSQKELAMLCKKILVNILIIALFAGIVQCTSWYKSIHFKTFLGGILEFSIFFFAFFLVNYFCIPTRNNRKNILVFLKQIASFLKNYFLVHLLFLIVVLSIFDKYKEVSLALVGAYSFFCFSKVIEEYQKTKQENTSMDFLKLVILNIGNLYYFTYISAFLDSVIKKGAILGVNLIDLGSHLFVFLITILIVYYLDALSKKMKKHFKK